MQNVTIYHNPKCSKSREALALIEERGIKPTIILYLEQPPTIEQLQQLLRQLGFNSARQLMRKKEDLYTELHLNDETLSEEQLLQAMNQHPKLIERPIVVTKDKAKLGRPNADNILTILD